jgi:hypothetical protein
MNRKKRRATGRSAAKSAHDTKQQEAFQALVGVYRQIAGDESAKLKQITDVTRARSFVRSGAHGEVVRKTSAVMWPQHLAPAA